MSRIYNPPHPGKVLKDAVCSSGLRVRTFAKQLRVPRESLAEIVAGRAPIGPELAQQLAGALGGSAESWLRMQEAYDMWQTHTMRRQKIE